MSTPPAARNLEVSRFLLPAAGTATEICVASAIVVVVDVEVTTTGVAEVTDETLDESEDSDEVTDTDSLVDVTLDDVVPDTSEAEDVCSLLESLVPPVSVALVVELKGPV